MRLQRLAGVHRRSLRHGQRAEADLDADRVQRRFRADAPDRLWVTDITQHRTAQGWVYCRGRARRVLPPRRGLVDR